MEHPESVAPLARREATSSTYYLFRTAYLCQHLSQEENFSSRLEVRSEEWHRLYRQARSSLLVGFLDRTCIIHGVFKTLSYLTFLERTLVRRRRKKVVASAVLTL